LLKIALLSSKKQKEALNKHFQKFAYMPMYDIDYDKYDLKYFKGKLADINKKTAKTQIEKEIADIEKKYKVRKSNYSRIIKEFSKNKELFYISKFFADYSYLKDFKPYTRDNGGFYIKPLFLEVAKRTNLSLDQALSLNEEEIPKMLNEEIHLNPADLEVRMKNSAYLCEDGYITLVTNKKELEKLDRVLNPSEEIIELKGLGVSEGFAKGKVSVILSNNDFKKFKEGGILVTSATRPDFVPLMKKAIATVTDEGGILSHAAIISRELGKPCIVGTAKATRVLKDGDLVEVDADRGVVKILKHG
jgi:phosphoenolpyruvate synthase/pyruvate phosphate dikinase